VADFIEVAALAQVPPGTPNCFTVVGRDVAVFNVDGSIYAIERASLGTERLQGIIDGWRYDVTTGSTVNVSDMGRLRTQRKSLMENF
jgi:nitrite reductase/ring-hydroxylating ferredoxin subunit